MIIDREALEPLLHLPQKIAAAHLNICVSSLKRVSRKLGIAKWKDWRGTGHGDNARLDET